MPENRMRMVLMLSDQRADEDNAASEIDEPELNGKIHELLERYVGAGEAKSDELLVELDFEAGTARLVSKKEAEG